MSMKNSNDTIGNGTRLNQLRYRVPPAYIVDSIKLET